ncbi:MAG TPA: sugar ABC transporter permease, partial [Treponemataceae bacterium]|nr:sugar ABC transporter permease [Treponemataceae bacterium]
MNVRGLQKSMREYGMYFALLIIMVFFTILTNGVFISPRNISNLFDQMGYIAVLGVGMTLILIIRSIDISVGFVCGLTGAILATGLKGGTIPPVLVVLLVLSVGIMIGVYHGFLVTKLFMPAWVVSLAGMFVFRGALLLVTEGTGTIIVDNPFFVALGNGFIPDLLGGGKVHGLTMLLAGIAIVLLVVSMSLQRAQVKKYGLDAGPTVLFLAKILIISSIILFFAWQLANYRGLSWTVVVVIVVVAIYHFFMSNTILGRHIYAV